jgi:hypothetical protein
MQVASLRWSFTVEHVRDTPDMQGVFTLWDGNECVYVGHTPWNRSLPECLRPCLALRDEGVIRASRFTWETTSTPKGREYDLLARSIQTHGRLPRYNRGNSPLRAPETSITDLRGPS